MILPNSTEMKRFFSKEWVRLITFVIVTLPFAIYFEWQERFESFFQGLSPATICVDGSNLLLSGDIASHSYSKWLNAIRNLEGRDQITLYLNSGGGDVEVAERIATDIRRLNMKTVLKEGAVCNSACTALFASGTVRVIDPTVQLGFHAESWGFRSLRYTTSGQQLLKPYMQFPDIISELDSKSALSRIDMTYLRAPRLVELDSSFATLEKITTRPRCENSSWF